MRPFFTSNSRAACSTIGCVGGDGDWPAANAVSASDERNTDIERTALGMLISHAIVPPGIVRSQSAAAQSVIRITKGGATYHDTINPGKAKLI